MTLKFGINHPLVNYHQVKEIEQCFINYLIIDDVSAFYLREKCIPR